MSKATPANRVTHTAEGSRVKQSGMGVLGLQKNMSKSPKGAPHQAIMFTNEEIETQEGAIAYDASNRVTSNLSKGNHFTT